MAICHNFRYNSKSFDIQINDRRIHTIVLNPPFRLGGTYRLDFASLLLLALALAMDAFAVSVTEGIRTQDIRNAQALKLSGFFGFFQALMPVIGFLAGTTIYSYIEKVDHFVAFGLLSFIGIRMIYESIHDHSETNTRTQAANTKDILLLSIATSIDALAVGISLAIQNANIWVSALVIGLVTFALCYLGVILGKRLGERLQKRAQIFGGLLLIVLGLKILFEHLSAV